MDALNDTLSSLVPLGWITLETVVGFVLKRVVLRTLAYRLRERRWQIQAR